MSTENTTNVATNTTTVSREEETPVLKKVLPTYKDFFDTCSNSTNNTSGILMRNFLSELEKTIALFIPNFPELNSFKARISSVKDAIKSFSCMSVDEKALISTLAAHIDVFVEGISE